MIESRGLLDVAVWLPDAVVVVDASARLVWANDAAERLFGMDSARLAGTDGLAFVHPDDKEVAAVSLTSVQGKDVGTPIEVRVRTADGWRLVEIIGANLLDRPTVRGLVLCLRDLTQRRRWELASGDEVGRFRTLVHNAASVIMQLDAAGRIESVSAAITRLLGLDQELVEGRPLVEFVAAHDRGAWQAALARAVDVPSWSTSPTVVELELLRRGGAASVPFELSIVNLLDDPTVGGLVVSGHDITQLRATREALEEFTTFDALTGLPNRATLRAHLERCLENPSTAVVFLDLDGFRPLNEQYGTATGDAILQCLAHRLESSVRKGDVVARYGGDEFVVVASIARPEELESLAARLAAGIEEPVDLPEGTFHVSASVGLAFPGPGDTATALLGRADAAMFIAKQHAEGGGHLQP
ncbi:MAG TPA: sensor domain-containing diguanylate cyclase [Acidimicrobiales bacterium]|nr:sensor domain-containing diguanylate cyclase [Acidimicrobiales bacterium]